MTDMRLFQSCFPFIAFSMLLLSSCGGPGPQEQKLPPGAQVRVDPASHFVTLDVKNVPFRAVLAELSRQAQITVSVGDNLQLDNLSLSFQNVPLGEALKRVLAGQAYSFIYAHDRGRDVITGVRLFAKQESAPSSDLRTAMDQVLAARLGHAAGQVSEPSDHPLPETKHVATSVIREDASIDELKSSFVDAQDPSLKSEILEAIAGSSTDEAQPVIPVLAAALSDRDEEVRATALNLMKASFEPLPIGPLAMMATTDMNPDLRLDAMTLMADQLMLEGGTKEDLIAVNASLIQGLSDPNQDVREQAVLTLEQLSQLVQTGGNKTHFERALQPSTYLEWLNVDV